MEARNTADATPTKPLEGTTMGMGRPLEALAANRPPVRPPKSSEIRESQDLSETNFADPNDAVNGRIRHMMPRYDQNDQELPEGEQKSAIHIRSHEIRKASKKLKRLQGKGHN